MKHVACAFPASEMTHCPSGIDAGLRAPFEDGAGDARREASHARYARDTGCCDDR